MTKTETLFDKIIAALPELANDSIVFARHQIILQNDSDGTGDYIAKWDYSTPLPESLAEYVRS